MNSMQGNAIPLKFGVSLLSKHFSILTYAEGVGGGGIKDTARDSEAKRAG